MRHLLRGFKIGLYRVGLITLTLLVLPWFIFRDGPAEMWRVFVSAWEACAQ